MEGVAQRDHRCGPCGGFLKYREVTGAIEKKVPGPRTSGGHERNRWAVINGMRVLRVTFPKIHTGDIPPGTLNSIRKQLRLDRMRFDAFVDCSMTGTEYEAHLQGLIEQDVL